MATIKVKTKCVPKEGKKEERKEGRKQELEREVYHNKVLQAHPVF